MTDDAYTEALADRLASEEFGMGFSDSLEEMRLIARYVHHLLTQLREDCARVADGGAASAFSLDNWQTAKAIRTLSLPRLED